MIHNGFILFLFMFRKTVLADGQVGSTPIWGDGRMMKLHPQHYSARDSMLQLQLSFNITKIMPKSIQFCQLNYNRDSSFSSLVP